MLSPTWSLLIKLAALTERIDVMGMPTKLTNPLSHTRAGDGLQRVLIVCLLSPAIGCILQDRYRDGLRPTRQLIPWSSQPHLCGYPAMLREDLFVEAS